MASKEIDRYLKAQLEKVPDDIKHFRDNKLEKKMTYYTGNWQTDVLNNLTTKQAERLFTKMRKLQDAGGLAFFQKRLDPIQIKESEYGEAETIYGYEYIVIRSQMVKPNVH